MTWRGYLAIKQLPPFWSAAQIGQAQTALNGIGLQNNPQPAKITHSAKFYDGLVILIEGEFSDAEVARAALVTTINNGVTGSSEAEINTWLDFELLDYPNAWTSGLTTTHVFADVGTTTATGFTPSGGFCIIFLSDTQYLSVAEYATVFQWIVDNKTALGIEAVLSPGDLVETYTDTTQWGGVDAAFDKLDTASIPYHASIGNHDYLGSGYTAAEARNANNFNTYMPQSRYTGFTFYEASHSENAYFTKTISGQVYLFIGLEFGPRAAVMTWADGAISGNPTAKIILTTHSYLYRDGTRVTTTTPFRPSLYQQCDADSTDGATMWTNVLKLYSNVMIVLCGHDQGDGTARWTSLGDNNNKVNQILAGHIARNSVSNRGCVRVINIRPADSAISVRTYSVLDGVWMTDPANKFELAI